MLCVARNHHHSQRWVAAFAQEYARREAAGESLFACLSGAHEHADTATVVNARRD